MRTDNKIENKNNNLFLNLSFMIKYDLFVKPYIKDGKTPPYNILTQYLNSFFLDDKKRLTINKYNTIIIYSLNKIKTSSNDVTITVRKINVDDNKFYYENVIVTNKEKSFDFFITSTTVSISSRFTYYYDDQTNNQNLTKYLEKISKNNYKELYQSYLNTRNAITNFEYKNKSYNRFVLLNESVIEYVKTIDKTKKCIFNYPKDKNYLNQSKSNIGETPAYELLIDIFDEIKKMQNLDKVNKISYNLQMLNLIQSYNYVNIIIAGKCNEKFLTTINEIRNKSLSSRNIISNINYRNSKNRSDNTLPVWAIIVSSIATLTAIGIFTGVLDPEKGIWGAGCVRELRTECLFDEAKDEWSCNSYSEDNLDNLDNLLKDNINKNNSTEGSDGNGEADADADSGAGAGADADADADAADVAGGVADAGEASDILLATDGVAIESTAATGGFALPVAVGVTAVVTVGMYGYQVGADYNECIKENKDNCLRTAFQNAAEQIFVKPGKDLWNEFINELEKAENFISSQTNLFISDVANFETVLGINPSAAANVAATFEADIKTGTTEIYNDMSNDASSGVSDVESDIGIKPSTAANDVDNAANDVNNAANSVGNFIDSIRVYTREEQEAKNINCNELKIVSTIKSKNTNKLTFPGLQLGQSYNYAYDEQMLRGIIKVYKNYIKNKSENNLNLLKKVCFPLAEDYCGDISYITEEDCKQVYTIALVRFLNYQWSFTKTDLNNFKDYNLLSYKDYKESKSDQEELLKLFMPLSYNNLKEKIKFNEYLYELIKNCHKVANNKKYYNIILSSI